jgi:hypothetical protein
MAIRRIPGEYACRAGLRATPGTLAALTASRFGANDNR